MNPFFIILAISIVLGILCLRYLEGHFSREYEIIDTYDLESEADRVAKLGFKPTSWNSFEKIRIIVLKCKHTGKVKIKKIRY